MSAEKHRPGHGHDCDRPATKRDIQEIGRALGDAMGDAFEIILEAIHGEQAATKSALDKVFKASEKQTKKLEKLTKS